MKKPSKSPKDSQNKIIASVAANDPSVIEDFWYFARLSNEYFSLIGANVYMETTEKGFAMFMDSLEDLTRVHSIPSIDNSKFKELYQRLKKQTNQGTIKPQSFYWYIKILQKPEDCSYPEILAILADYWKFFMADVKEVKKEGESRIIIRFIDSKLYKLVLKEQIKRIKESIDEIKEQRAHKMVF